MDPRKLETTNEPPKHRNDDRCNQNGVGLRRGRRTAAAGRLKEKACDEGLGISEAPREWHREARDGVARRLFGTVVGLCLLLKHLKLCHA